MIRPLSVPEIPGQRRSLRTYVQSGPASTDVECIYLSLPPSSSTSRRFPFPFPSASVCVMRSTPFRTSLHLHPLSFLSRSLFFRSLHLALSFPSACLYLSICPCSGVSNIYRVPMQCKIKIYPSLILKNVSVLFLSFLHFSCFLSYLPCCLLLFVPSLSFLILVPFLLCSFFALFISAFSPSFSSSLFFFRFFFFYLASGIMIQGLR